MEGSSESRESAEMRAAPPALGIIPGRRAPLARAAAGSLAGTTAEACFAVAYARLAAQHRWPACLAGGSAAFVASGLLLTRLALSPLVLFVVAMTSLVAGVRLLARPAATASEVELPRWDLPLRIAVATALVLLITSIARVIGPDLSGLAAAATVLGVFAHRHDGALAAQSVMRGLLLGLFGFAGFFATVSLLVTRANVATAFTAALVVTLLIQGASLVVLRKRAA